MNSLLSIRSAFVTKVSEVISSYNLANGTNVAVTFDNEKAFDPSPYEYFAFGSLIPVISDHNGKRNNDPDMDEGIYQVSIHGLLENGKYDITHQSIVDYIKSELRGSSPIGDIYIANINSNSGRKLDTWWVVDLSINWFVISA